jgi:hypothetical protein
MLSHLEFLDDVYQQVKFNPWQAQSIYEKARDCILSNHRDAVDCAAALFDAATSLHKQPPSAAEWKLLDDIRASSDRLTPSNDETRKRRALASLVAIWSWDVVCHYGWTGSSRTTVELLRQCALSFPDFGSQVVPLGRYILVRRHEESLFNSRVPSVGEHHSSSKGSLAHSPLTTYDIQLLASFGKDGGDTGSNAYGVAMQPKTAGSPEEIGFQQRWCKDDFEIEVRGKSLASLRPMQTQNFLLGFDRFGLLVPRKFAVAPSKRRRTSARSQSRTGRHQSLPASKHCGTDYSSARAAAKSHKGLNTVKEKTLKQKGGNAGKDTLKASILRRDEVRDIQDNTQIGDDRDRAGSSIEKNTSQSSAPTPSTEIEESPNSPSEVQREGSLLRTASALRSDAKSPAASEDHSDELARADNPKKHDSRSNSLLVNASTKARKTHDQHMSDVYKMDRVTLYALDLASATLCQRQTAHGVSLDSIIRQRHSHLIRVYTDRVGKSTVDRAEHRVRKSWLRPNTSWAKIYISPESDLGRGESATEHDADVIYTSGQDLYKLSQQGKTFTKPVVIKEEFADAGLVTLDDFASLLVDRYHRDTVQVRPLGCSMTESEEVSAFV